MNPRRLLAVSGRLKRNAMVVAAAFAALTGTAQAALVSLGDGTVKDTNTNLIWLQNWNVNGQQTWSTQKAWAEGLSYAGSTDWVLPEISEYDALYAEYGDLIALSAFTNVQSGVYWSGTEIPEGNVAWRFLPVFGGQIVVASQFTPFFAVAVRPGEVESSVPEPQTLALALLALGVTVVARRRRSR